MVQKTTQKTQGATKIMLLEKLFKLANKLDELGHRKEADEIDALLKTASASIKPKSEETECKCSK